MNKPSSGKVNIMNELQTYLKYWYWFAMGVVLFVGAGYLYLKYTTPIFSASASIIINEESGSGDSAEIPVVALSTGLKTNNLEKEIAIIKSRRLMSRVVKALNINIRYFIEGEVRDVELYQDLPFSLSILKLNENDSSEIGEVGYNISLNKEQLSFIHLQTFEIIKGIAGAPVELDFGTVVLNPKKGEDKFSNITMQFSEITPVASQYSERLQIIKENESSNILKLRLEDPVIEKAKDIINQVIFEFNKDAIEDKNLIAGNSAKFINERLQIINDELEFVESGKEEFKENNRITDLQAESQMFVQTASAYNKKEQELGTQIELVNAMLEYLTTNSNKELLPANLGIEENSVNEKIEEYNALVLERNRIMKSSTELNPTVVRLDNNIDQIRANILLSLKRLRKNLEISQNDITSQVRSIGSKILSVPSLEREYRGIERQQGVKEALYLYLLKKREENSLALAVTAPKAKIVDSAHSSGMRASPNSKSIILGTIVLGLFIPFSVIYVRNLVDNKIRKRSDVDELLGKNSVLAELPRVLNKAELLIRKNDRSNLSEAFRFLYTRLQFQNEQPEQNLATKVLVTSSIKGEGKTFTSINLASIMANCNKKVLLIGADLRNPRLNGFLEANECNYGLSNYLSNSELNYHGLIRNSKIHPNCKIIAAGSIPPNPSELLRQVKFKDLIADLEKEFNYIIIDSAPIMLVADSMLLSKYASQIIFVLKAGGTNKQHIEFALDSFENQELDKIKFILNNVPKANLGYGERFSYGIADQKKSKISWRAFFNL